MDYRLRVKRLGNHWYPDIEHNDPYDLTLSPKIEKILDVFDKNKSGDLEVRLIETFSVIDNATVLFNDEDILRYLTTTDEFNLKFYVDDREFEISSNLFNLLEYQYNPNFHKIFYRIEISDWTV